MKRGARCGAKSPALFFACPVAYPNTSDCLYETVSVRGKIKSEKNVINPIDKAKRNMV